MKGISLYYLFRDYTISLPESTNEVRLHQILD